MASVNCICFRVYSWTNSSVNSILNTIYTSWLREGNMLDKCLYKNDYEILQKRFTVTQTLLSCKGRIRYRQRYTIIHNINFVKNHFLGESAQRLRNSWPRSWIHLLHTHLEPTRTGHAAWRVCKSPSPDLFKFHQKAASPSDGLNWAPALVNTVHPPNVTSVR